MRTITTWRYLQTLYKVVIVLAFSLLGGVFAVHADNTGAVTYLSPSGSNPVNISAEVRVTDGILNNTNLRFFIRDSSNNIVYTHGPVSVPRLEIGQTQTFSSNWTWNSPGLGDHTVELCWSPGNASNCEIASSQTNFTSVPSLGFVFTALSILLIVFWFRFISRTFQPNIRKG